MQQHLIRINFSLKKQGTKAPIASCLETAGKEKERNGHKEAVALFLQIKQKQADRPDSVTATGKNRLL